MVLFLPIGWLYISPIPSRKGNQKQLLNQGLNLRLIYLIFFLFLLQSFWRRQFSRNNLLFLLLWFDVSRTSNLLDIFFRSPFHHLNVIHISKCLEGVLSSESIDNAYIPASSKGCCWNAKGWATLFSMHEGSPEKIQVLCIYYPPWN